MGAAINLKPLTDTIRVIEWDELPESVREIPEGFNPLDQGVLMAHQIEWLELDADIKVAPKGRRTGITFCTALDKSLVAASRKSAGGRDVFYIGDTKEKGLEFIGYCAKFLQTIAKAQKQGMSSIEEFLFEDQDEDGKTRYITSYRIRLSSGFKVVALSSNPANIRGLQGDVVIDEAGFHPNVQAVIDAAAALLIWGAQICIISSHNGVKNPFNQLVKDIENGVYGDTAKVLTIPFDTAVANGLYERRCFMKGETPTAEGKEKWYKKIRLGYGPRKAQMREELDAIPRDGSGTTLPSVWIERAMPEVRTVLRLALDDEFVKRPVRERESYVEDWIKRYLQPELDKIKNNHELRKAIWYYSQDYARHRDFSVITPGIKRQNLSRYVPFVIELHKVPAAQQHQIIWYMIDGLPGYPCGAIDATGSGETTAELTADRYGHDRVLQIKINRNWYGLWMPKMTGLFADEMIDIPRDLNLEQDLRSIETVDGIEMVSPLRKEDLKDPDLMRHGDFAIALCLLNCAMMEIMYVVIEFISAPSREEMESSDKYDDWSSMDQGCY